MAREGGIGFIHKNLKIEDQAREVDAREEGAVRPRRRSGHDRAGAHARGRARGDAALQDQQPAGGRRDKRPVGILTNRDVRFEKRLGLPVGEVMTKKLVTARDGVELEEAK